MPLGAITGRARPTGSAAGNSPRADKLVALAPLQAADGEHVAVPDDALRTDPRLRCFQQLPQQLVLCCPVPCPSPSDKQCAARRLSASMDGAERSSHGMEIKKWEGTEFNACGGVAIAIASSVCPSSARNHCVPVAIGHRLVLGSTARSQPPLRLAPVGEVLNPFVEDLDAPARGIAVVEADLVGEVLGVERQVGRMNGPTPLTLGNLRKPRVEALADVYAAPGLERAGLPPLPSALATSHNALALRRSSSEVSTPPSACGVVQNLAQSLIKFARLA